MLNLTKEEKRDLYLSYLTPIGLVALGSLGIYYSQDLFWYFSDDPTETIKALGGLLILGISSFLAGLGGGSLAGRGEELKLIWTERHKNREKITAQEGMITEVVDNGDLTGAVSMSTDAVKGDLDILD